MKTKLIAIMMLLRAAVVFADSPPLPSIVTFQNAETNTVVVKGEDAAGDSFKLYLAPGQTLKQVFTGASFRSGPDSAWTQNQPIDGTDMQVLICGPLTDSEPTFMVAFTPPLVPDSLTIVQYWIWGVCTAIVLGLAGSMRRMLGRVHEVNTDL